jgi:hypothetical protein
MKTEILIVYRLFDYEDDFKWKNFELQICRSCRKLQFSYKVYLHPSSNKKYKFLKTDWTPTAVAHGGSNCHSTTRVPNVVGHDGAIPSSGRCKILHFLRTYVFEKREKCKKNRLFSIVFVPCSGL